MRTKIEFEDSDGTEERRIQAVMRADDMQTALRAVYAVLFKEKHISEERFIDILRSLEIYHLVA